MSDNSAPDASQQERAAPIVKRRSRVVNPRVVHIILIFGIALTIRLLYWADARAYSLGGDEVDYVIPAQTLLREGRYVDTFVSHDRPWTRVPLTAFFFAASFLGEPAAAQAQGDDAALMESRYDALNMAQIAISLVTIALIMLLAARAFPQKAWTVATIAGYITAIYPPLASSPAQRALSEPLAVMLLCLAFLVLSYWSPALPARRTVMIAIGVGLLFGIASLVRAIGLAMVPLACVWLFASRTEDAGRRTPDEVETPGQQDPEIPNRKPGLPGRLRALAFSKASRPSWLASGLLVAAALVAVAPWTAYNYVTYRTFLLLETANATAYWHYHNFRGEDYMSRLQALPNPADRLNLIVRGGTANIIEYPDRAARSAVFAFGYFWHLELNSAVHLNPWDMTQRDPDVPDLLHSDALFLLVGLTGMAGLAGVGLRRVGAPGGRMLLMLNLWLGSMVLLGIVVPYDGRYRLPAVPPIIVMAAGLLALANWRAVFSPRHAWATLRSHKWVAAGTALLLAWVLWGAYTPDIPPLMRSLYQGWRGDTASSYEDASGRYALAQEAYPEFYWAYRHAADAARAQGKDEEARDLYERARQRNNDDPYGMLGFADLAARHPEWTLSVAERAWLARDEEDWRGNPWNSFRPSATRSIDVGSGTDIPYLRGFHRPDRAPDMTYRWSRGRALLRLPIPPPSPGSSYNSLDITLRMSAPAIGPGDPMPVTISVEGGPSTHFTVPVGWADYTITVPADSAQVNKVIWIEITSPIREPSEEHRAAGEERSLGVGLDSVSIR